MKKENRYKNGKISEEKFKIIKDFVKQRNKNLQENRDNYDKMSREEKIKFDLYFKKLTEEMSEYFLKIIKGSINYFKVSSQIKNYEEIQDIIQDAYITVMTYINRYNELLTTSAFAYVTQLAKNSILFSLNKLKLKNNTLVTGLDYYNNLSGENQFEKFYKDFEE